MSQQISRGVCTDTFSSLDDVPAKQHGNLDVVAAALKVAGRFSCFEVTPKLGHTLAALERAGRLRYTDKLGYPWVTVEIVPP